MENTTISCFFSFIYLENFFCINRSYLISDRRYAITGNIISILIFIAIIIAFVNDILFGEIDVHEKMFQGVLAAELLVLAIGVRYKNVSFTAFERLDQKCGIDEQYIKKLVKIVRRETVIGVLSIIIDIGGIFTLGVPTVKGFSYIIMFAAHEAETVFFALIIKAMNLRLLKLNQVTPSAGSRVYRHVLIASSQMNVDFTSRILMLLGVLLFTTISYCCTVLLMFSEMGVDVAVYLLWRESKSMYCLWSLCRTSSESETICQQLAFQLANKLAFDPAFDKVRNLQAYSIIKRWYVTLLNQRPRYVRGSIFSIGLGIPLHLIDISINYVLIIIQIYVAYK